MLLQRLFDENAFLLLRQTRALMTLLKSEAEQLDEHQENYFMMREDPSMSTEERWEHAHQGVRRTNRYNKRQSEYYDALRFLDNFVASKTRRRTSQVR